MAMNPKPTKVSVRIDDYYCLGSETKREHCETQRPHWHLYKDGVPVWCIFANLTWLTHPKNIEPKIIDKVIEETNKHAVELYWAFSNNAMHGAV